MLKNLFVFFCLIIQYFVVAQRVGVVKPLTGSSIPGCSSFHTKIFQVLFHLFPSHHFQLSKGFFMGVFQHNNLPRSTEIEIIDGRKTHSSNFRLLLFWHREKKAPRRKVCCLPVRFSWGNFNEHPVKASLTRREGWNNDRQSEAGECFGSCNRLERMSFKMLMMRGICQA